MVEPGASAPATARTWPRAAALYVLTMSLSAFRPTVLVAVPVLLLVALRRRLDTPALGVVLIALWVMVLGERTDLWYVERAWALMAAGWFVALTLAGPAWTLSSRCACAVAGALASSAALLAARAGAWEALDWAVKDTVFGSVAATLDALALLRQGAPMSPGFVAGMYRMAEAQASVFPALVALASMAALGVATWVSARATGSREEVIGPVGGFRFNDHLVWVMIGGLALVLVRMGDLVTRLGANVVVFMGALYALRGAGVVMFVSGGLSALGYALVVAGLFLAAPVVLGLAIVIGIGDTWLDLRARAPESAA